MPVRIKSAPHGAEEVRLRSGPFAKSAADVLNKLCPKEGDTPYEILQSSFEDAGLPNTMIASPNGLVNATLQAYSSHHHLRLRPEDIWFAILTQFSFYVNAHAEELRDQFVAHQGKEKLTLKYGGLGRHDFDFGVFARDMNRLIEKNIVDPEFRDWMIPAFTTTSRQDEIIASIIMMGTTQNYFIFECIIMCGIPSVTLEGEKKDYQAILDKLEKLKEYGDEPTQFASLLKPVLSRIVRSFDEPEHKDILDFWHKIFSSYSLGSGSPVYSGWMTAFCFWDEEGHCLYRKCADRKRKEYLHLDKVQYHKVSGNQVPAGWTKVPVIVNDHGKIVDTEMVAGSTGITCFSDEQETRKDKREILDSMRPETGWWIIEKNPDLARQEAEIKQVLVEIQERKGSEEREKAEAQKKADEAHAAQKQQKKERTRRLRKFFTCGLL